MSDSLIGRIVQHKIWKHIDKNNFAQAKTTEGKRIKIPADMKYPEWKAVYIDKSTNSTGALNDSKPQLIMANFYDVAKIRNIDEFNEMAKKLQSIVEKYVERKSLWSGHIILRTDCYPHKDWNCDIVLLPNATEYIVLHEMIHSCSISHFGKKVFYDNVLAEELATHYLGQEIAAKEGFVAIETDYNEGVELIRDFRKALNIQGQDLDFAIELIRQPPQERWNWLEGLIADSFDITSTSVTVYQNWLNKLEKIKKWIPPS